MLTDSNKLWRHANNVNNSVYMSIKKCKYLYEENTRPGKKHFLMKTNVNCHSCRYRLSLTKYSIDVFSRLKRCMVQRQYEDNLADEYQNSLLAFVRTGHEEILEWC